MENLKLQKCFGCDGKSEDYGHYVKHLDSWCDGKNGEGYGHNGENEDFEGDSGYKEENEVFRCNWNLRWWA